MRKTIILLVIAISFCITGQGKIGDMKFRHLDTRHGLSNSQVNCILQDSRGFIWICTSFGLCRYDGYRFQNYFSYERDTTTLRSNRMDDVQEAYDGKLWLNHGMSYSLYDPVTEKTDRSPGLWLAKQGVTGGIEKLHIDSQKNFWVKSYEDGFFFYNPKKKLLKKVDFGYTIDKFPKDFSVTSFCETEDGMVMTSNMGELICVDGQRGRVLWRDDTVKKALDTYNDYWVYVDKDGLRWVITHSTNTYIYNPAEKRWYTSLTELMKAKGFSDVPEDVVVWEVRYDARGLLWVATDHLGVLVLDFQNKEWKQFNYQKGDNTSLPDITAKHLYVDPLGRMWVATYKSGVAMCADAMASFTSLPYGDINAICEDKEGYYWLGLNSGGIRKMDPETLEIVAEYDKQVLGTPNAVIVGAYCAKDGTLWFGTWEGGLIRYRDGQWKTYMVGTPGSGLTTNNVWSITEDLWGNIWVGLLGGGAMRIDAKSGVQRVFNETNSNLKTNWTNSINTASNGWILLGNAEYCSVIHPKTYQIINIPVPHDETTYTISSATIQAIWDKRGLVWQAASSGLSIYDRKTGKTRLLDMKSGFFGSNVTSITEDAQQTIWVTTDHGISNVVPQKGEDGEWHFTVRSFNEHDGLQPGPFNQRAICYTSTGMILVGGQDGLDIINTKNLAVGHLDEKPVFSGLQLFDKDVAVGEEVDGRVILKEALNVCREITLNFNDQFTIQMGSNAGSIANTKRFVYMLEGFNESWVRTSDLNPNITYNSLRAGDYTLRVRMLNDDGTFGQEEATLEITIRPSLWRTRWMILLYMLIIAGVAFVWRKWFMKRLENRMKVETMRRELEQQQWMNEMRMKIATEQVNKQPSEGAKQETVKLNLTTEDLVVFIRAICEHYESPIPDKKVKVSFLSAVDQLTADFDEAKLKEILEILFRNSINFTPYDPLISVGVARIQNDMAQIQVADNGIGIKDEYKEHAFDPMVNGEGIGLDRVKSIVDAHKGTIRIEDNPGGGTIFFITLPAQPEIEVVEAEVVND
jgi:ligand-binding sensor domain-containing protein